MYNDLKLLDDAQLSAFLTSYQTFKYPKFGKANPTNITNPYYQWIVKHRLSAWDIENIIIDVNNQQDKFDTPPLWCFDRMGQTQTTLPDKRVVLIGGEYEDYYDPDFCIYNDVAVVYPSTDEVDDSVKVDNEDLDAPSSNQLIKVYNYPKNVFPPTDFHTATLVGDEIFIIGSLGYVDDRQFSQTSVYKLNIHTFKIEQVATRNSMGWIHNHEAALKDNRIIVTGGLIQLEPTQPPIDNLDTWALNLKTLIWKNLTNSDRNWQRFYVRRQDYDSLHLSAYHFLDCSLLLNDQDSQQREWDALTKAINHRPDIDSYRKLFVPPIDHEIIDDDANKQIAQNGSKASTTATVTDCKDTESQQAYRRYIIYRDYQNHTLYIDGIKVRYQAKYDSIHVIIEGKLSDEVLELLQQNLRHKLSKIENMACEVG